ncbi:hypothetical protein Tco_0227865 [Tanacetum coccineum]
MGSRMSFSKALIGMLSPDPNGTNASFEGVSFRLRGECRTMSLLELGWRVELYLEDFAFDDGNIWILQNSLTVKREMNKIRDPRVRLAHRCLTMTISGRTSSTQRLARYLKRARTMSVLCGGMFMTRITRSFGLLSREMVDALSIELRAQTFTKKSLISMGIIMKLDGGNCFWPATQGVGDDDDDDEKRKSESPLRRTET